MNARNIFMVARYESLVISRSFVFRILAFLALLGITYIQVMMQGDGMAYTWTMVATSSSMPLVNAYLFNVLQAFVLVFIVTNYSVRECRCGFLECIHARSISNQDYFLGKVIGTVWIFSCLNVISGLICSLINLVASEAPWNPLIYLFYFITLTTPSLIFFTGLSFFITLILRVRILAQGILLLMLYFMVIYLPEISHGSFDFTGSALPNLFSEITGHPGMENYLLHRFSFLFLGMSFLLFSISLLQRMPNSSLNVSLMRRIGYLILLSGVLAGGIRFYSYKHSDAMREAFRESFDRHWDANTCRVRSHAIRYYQEDDRLTLVSDMLLCNPGDTLLSSVVLFLNPGLSVSGVREGGRDLKFQRDCQVLLIERELPGKDSIELQISYSGKIDERYCYLAVSDERYYNPRREDRFFNFGDRYVCVGDKFTWLVPECGWYPVAIPDSPRASRETGRDYTSYRLDIEQPKRRVVLSQGVVQRKGDTLSFTTPHPLEGISLCIGDYTGKRVQTSGFVVEVYSFRENNAISLFFDKLKQNDVQGVLEKVIGRSTVLTSGSLSIADSISGVCFRKDWCYDRNSRLIVAELPLSLTSFHDDNKRRSAWVQPGMLFYPERGSRGLVLTIPGQLKRRELRDGNPSEMKRRELEKSELSTLVTGFISRYPWREGENPFLRSIFGVNQEREGEFLEVLSRGFTLIYEPGVYISSESYPFLDAVCKEWFWEGFKPAFGSDQGLFGNMSFLDTRVVMQGYSLEDALSNLALNPMTKNVFWEMKYKELLDLLCAKASRERLTDFFKKFYQRHTGEVPEHVFLEELEDSCGVDIREFYADWFYSSPQNMYRIKDEKITKVHHAERNKLVGEFKIQHVGDTKGYISILSDNPITRKQVRKLYCLEPGACYQFRFPIGMGRFWVNTNISKNLPGEIFVELGIGVDNKYIYEWGKDTSCGMFKISPTVFEKQDDDCIVVDNESPDFSLQGPPEKWLQRLLGRDDKLYTEVDLPTVIGTWGKMHAGRYYGESVRSAYGKLAESGLFKAQWTAEVKVPGKYEVFVLIHDSYMFSLEGKKERLEYHYTLEFGDKRQEVVLPLVAGQKGWVSLGKFDILSEKMKITLDDRGLSGQIIYADAVKLCKVSE